VLRLDEDNQRLGQDPVIGHCLCGLRGFHRGHQRIHVGHVHQHGDVRLVRQIDKGSNVGHSERAEELFPFRRVKPVTPVLDFVGDRSQSAPRLLPVAGLQIAPGSVDGPTEGSEPGAAYLSGPEASHWAEPGAVCSAIISPHYTDCNRPRRD